jgi:hypothetical protein
MNVHTDILDTVHRVLLCAVSLVVSATKRTIPSKGRPFIMRALEFGHLAAPKGQAT